LENLEHCALPVGYQAILAIGIGVPVEDREMFTIRSVRGHLGVLRCAIRCQLVVLSIVERFVAQGANR
jgi:hypothetical protein